MRADFNEQYGEYLNCFNSYLCEYIENTEKSLTGKGERLMLEAMKYSLDAGGKRIRPVFAMAFCRACGADYKNALPMALAAEMLHTYSLIHDDLPCMDNDDLRRGKPSSHIKFGYANALLAGDSLLTLSFEILSDGEKDADKALKCVRELSRLAGFRGMIAGQAEDLINEGEGDITLSQITAAETLKTACLIESACVMGCIAADADEDMLKAARQFANYYGLGFQLRDDLLDVIKTSEQLGKPAGSDLKQGKNNFITFLGKNGVCEKMDYLKEKALEEIKIFGDNGEFIRQMINATMDWRKL